jgi:hypothetical protein
MLELLTETRNLTAFWLGACHCLWLVTFDGAFNSSWAVRWNCTYLILSDRKSAGKHPAISDWRDFVRGAPRKEINPDSPLLSPRNSPSGNDGTLNGKKMPTQ